MQGNVASSATLNPPPSKGHVMSKLPACMGTVALLIALVGCAKGDGPLLPPVPPTPQTMEMSVTLYHCGFHPITYHAKKWEAGSAARVGDI